MVLVSPKCWGLLLELGCSFINSLSWALFWDSGSATRCQASCSGTSCSLWPLHALKTSTTWVTLTKFVCQHELQPWLLLESSFCALTLRKHSPGDFAMMISFINLFIILFLKLQLNHNISSFPCFLSNPPIYPLLSFKFMISHFTCCYCITTHIYIDIYIPKYNWLSLYNVTHMYVFRAHYSAPDNQLVCSSLRKTTSCIPRFP